MSPRRRRREEILEGPKPEEQTEQPETKEAQPASSEKRAPEPGEPQAGGVEGWVRKWGPLVMLVIMAVGILVSLGNAIYQGWAAGHDGAPQPAQVSLLSFVPQVKRKGVRPWGEVVEMPEEGGRILLGLRAQPTTSETISGLTVHLTVPAQATLVPGSCRYGLDGPATTPIPTSIANEGVELPDLGFNDWGHLVCAADVSGEAHGGRYKAKFSVISNQTIGADGSVTIKVPATSAEEAVRGLYSTTEEEPRLWGGEPEMGPKSKRLLISQWHAYTLEHGHRFAAIPAEKEVSVADLPYEHTLDGRIAELRAKVMARPGEYPAGAGMVKESVELGLPGDAARLICYVPRPANHLVTEGEVLRVKAVLIAWSPRSSAGGEALTMGVCPAVEVDRSPPPFDRRPRPGAAAE
jgi:hypothetical protein